jgi:hypothetical protein
MSFIKEDNAWRQLKVELTLLRNNRNALRFANLADLLEQCPGVFQGRRVNLDERQSNCFSPTLHDEGLALSWTSINAKVQASARTIHQFVRLKRKTTQHSHVAVIATAYNAIQRTLRVVRRQRLKDLLFRGTQGIILESTIRSRIVEYQLALIFNNSHVLHGAKSLSK